MGNRFRYKVISEKTGKLEEYSGSFKTIKDARKWYEKHGKWLEEQFNRKLVLTGIN